jgi:hypothetical protein
VSEVPRVGRFYAAGDWRVYRLTNTNRIEEGSWTVPSEIPERYNSCCSRGAAGMFSGRLRQLAATAIETDMHQNRHDSGQCYACYGEIDQPKHTKSPDCEVNVTDVTDVTSNRRGCTWRPPDRALTHPRPPVVDTPLNCRNIRNIRNIGGRRRGVLLRQQNLPVTSVTSVATCQQKLPVVCYGATSGWSA